MEIGTYVIIADIAGYISGAPIYYRNKATFLESLGWNVLILATNGGRVYIEGLERFAAGTFAFLKEDPTTFPRGILDRHIEELVAPFRQGCGGPAIVETGTEWTAYWGEILAQRIQARHMVLFLDEDNRRIGDRIGFFNFKRLRGEMACITEQTMNNLFADVAGYDGSAAVGFQACCTNSVQDISTDFSNKLTLHGFNIGSIGRLDKPFVPGLIDEIRRFAEKHPDLDIQVVFFGGASPAVESRVRHAFDSCGNVCATISGFMWPFPKSSICAMDVFASAAGSKNISSELGIPTVAMDVTGSGAIGFVGGADVARNPLYRDEENSSTPEASFYFEQVYRGEVSKTESRLSLRVQWKEFCQEYHKQLDLALNCSSPLSYYDVQAFPISPKKRIKKVAYRLLGEQGTEKMALAAQSLMCKRSSVDRR